MAMADFTSSFDARDWAHAFVEMVNANPGIATDDAAMTGWFANALMRGWDEHARRNPGRDELLEAAHAALAQLTGGYPGDPLTERWFPNNATVHDLARAIYKAEGREVTHVA